MSATYGNYLPNTSSTSIYLLVKKKADKYDEAVFKLPQYFKIANWKLLLGFLQNDPVQLKWAHQCAVN